MVEPQLGGKLLRLLDTWDLDLFPFSSVDLCRLVYTIFSRHGALRFCTQDRLWAFINAVSSSYEARRLPHVNRIGLYSDAFDRRRICLYGSR